jgi:hypothetical protein
MKELRRRPPAGQSLVKLPVSADRGFSRDGLAPENSTRRRVAAEVFSIIDSGSLGGAGSFFSAFYLSPFAFGCHCPGVEVLLAF